jgi:plastocyanin
MTRLFIGLALIVALAACQADEPELPEADPFGPPEDAIVVEIEGDAFAEDELSVPVGSVVSWINNDDHDHTVAHGQDGVAAEDRRFNLPVPPGESRDFTFDEPGTYPVTCSIHPEMNMTVVVEE